MSGSGWNRPTGNQPAAKKGGAKAPSAMKGVVAGLVIVCALGGLCLWMFSGKDAEPKAKAEKERGLIKEVKPAVVAHSETKEEQKQVETAAPAKTDAPAKPAGKVIRPVGAKSGQVLTLADGTVITNKPRNIFKRDLEKTLYAALFPGSMTSGLFARLKAKYTDDQILTMLKEMTVPAEGDDAVAIGAKNRVQALKEDILLAVQDGASVSDVLDKIRRQRVEENLLRAQTAKLRREALKTGDPEIIRETIGAANQILEKNNIRKMPVPEQYRSEADAPEADSDPAADNNNAIGDTEE